MKLPSLWALVAVLVAVCAVVAHGVSLEANQFKEKDFLHHGSVEQFVERAARSSANYHNPLDEYSRMIAKKQPPLHIQRRNAQGVRNEQSVIPQLRVAVPSMPVELDKFEVNNTPEFLNAEPFFDWGSRADSSGTHEVAFELKNSHRLALEARLKKNPMDAVAHSELAKGLQYPPSRNDVTAENAVKEYLKRVGATVVRTDSVYIHAIASIEQWEHALKTEFYVMRTNVGDRSYLIRAKSYSLPKSIADYVETVHGVVDVPILSHDDPRNYQRRQREQIMRQQAAQDSVLDEQLE